MRRTLCVLCPTCCADLCPPPIAMPSCQRLRPGENSSLHVHCPLLKTPCVYQMSWPKARAARFPKVKA